MPISRFGSIRIIADDLTGALDCAAPFAALLGPLRVYSGRAPDNDASFVLNIRTREMAESSAAQRAREAAPLWAGADYAFKKIDSLMRGSIAAEIAASLDGFDRCVIAPAFPAQGRLTIKGRQWWTDDGGMKPLPFDLGFELSRHGVDAAVCERTPDMDSTPTKVIVCDATVQSDLTAIVDAGRAMPGRTLWCGTSGLARALVSVEQRYVPFQAGRTLVVIGSVHPVALRQKFHVEAQGLACFTFEGRDCSKMAAVGHALAERGLALIDFAAEPDCSQPVINQNIEFIMHRLAHSIARPDALIVVGGETLDLFCTVLDVGHLRVEGEWTAGIPVSMIADGPWVGTRVYSKSGAFGEEATLWNILKVRTHESHQMTAEGNGLSVLRYGDL